jgi:hypothetical protein
MTQDIFDNAILCGKCNRKMHKSQIAKNGFLIRAMVCDNCNERVLHPIDAENYNKFVSLRNKEFSVKMRMVGNSYAVSIPKEIVSFMSNQQKAMSDFDKMVRLCFEEMGRLSLNFGEMEKGGNARVIKSREVKVVRNSKPVLHERHFYDSAHPEKSFKMVKKAKEAEDGR